MVEKVSAVNVSTPLNSDSVSDDSVLLEWVEKKKKQNQQGEQPSLAAVTPQMLVQVLNGTLTSGGRQQKENVNKTLKAAAGFEPAQPFSRNDDGLRRKVMLAALTPVKQAAVPVKQADASVKQGDVPVKQADVAVKQVDAPVKQADAPVISQPMSTLPLQDFEGTSRHPGRSLQHKDELNEIKTLFTPGRSLDFKDNVQSEQQVQSKNVPATLQQLKGQANANAATTVPSAREAQTLEVDYSFQRWTGDHSVKVTIPAQSLREGNMTLLPSDARAADALSRNLGTLAGHSPELLQPREDRDEQQKREQPSQQDEEQE